MPANVRLGSAYGIVAWGAFAAMEMAACTLRPIAAGYYDVVETSHWYFVAILFVMYLAAGALLGGAAGYLLGKFSSGNSPDRKLSPAVLQTAVALTLVSFYIINLLIEREAGEAADLVALVTSLVALALLSARLAFPRRFQWAGIAGDPWIASSLLLGAPLFAGSLSQRNSIAVVLALVFAGFVSRRYLAPVGAASGMPMRQLGAVALAIPAVLLATAALTRDLAPLKQVANRQAPDQAHPNVVLVVMDTVRADHLSLYGYPRETTPNLQKFAQEASVYRRAMAASNWTLPSHASIFTGEYPRTHGAINYPPDKETRTTLEANQRTLAESLTDAGYLSVAVAANTAFVRPDFGLGQGFHFFDVRDVAPCLPDRGAYYPRRLMRRIMDRFLWTLEFDRQTRPASEITADAIHLVEEAHQRRQRFFLFINYMDAHEPYLPQQPFDAMFPGKNRRMTYDEYKTMMDEVVSRKRSMSAEETAHYVSQYDGALRAMDTEIARLFGRLKDLGLYDNSIIVITADHGEAFGEHHFVSHSQSLYQHQVYVPLVIKTAGQNEARSEDELVSHVDLMPTILASAGVDVPPGLQGQNLLSPDAGARRSIFAEAYTDEELEEFRPDYPKRQFAIFEDDLKLISSSNGGHELYDLRRDPAESRDLRQVDRASTKDLQAQLDAWLKSSPIKARQKKQMDQRTLDRLKSLGYMR